MVSKIAMVLFMSVVLVRVAPAQEKSLPLTTPVKQEATNESKRQMAKGKNQRAEGLPPLAKRSAPARVQKTAPVTKEVTKEKRARPLGKFTVVAYGPRDRNGRLHKRTVSGTTPTVGRTVAVDPRVIPLGSRIHIAGIGERIAEDIGGKIKGKKLDLFLPSRDHCRQFGAQIRDVHLVVE
jgi:3D (Asp-Asp-Asp) domain-containing protein